MIEKALTLLLRIFLTYCMFLSLQCIPKRETTPKKAVVIVPVADLVGIPIQQMATGTSTTQHQYERLPVCGGHHMPGLACPRIHQLLFNEVVEIIKQEGEEVCIRIPQLFYLVSTSGKPQVTYWTLEKNVKTFEMIQKNNGDLTKIPPPLSFKKENRSQKKETVVTLTQPWYNHKTEQTFSAGTRFIMHQKKKTHVCVYIFNPQTFQHERALIPKNQCFFYNAKQTETERRKKFVSLLRQWTTNNKQFIPYVWGGCSFVNSVTGPFSEIIERTDRGKMTSFFAFSGNIEKPKTGFDCAGMIARATQICGIPYFYKNSITIKKCLSPLTRNNRLLPGDIIWIPGHVMVVSSFDRHTLIEARSYKHGYGKTHEIALSKVFQNIITYHDLIDAYYNKKTVTRLDRDGNKQETTYFSLLRLIS